MGMVWTATLHRSTPSYFDESFRIGDIYLRKGQVYGCAIADRRPGHPLRDPPRHLARTGHPRGLGEHELGAPRRA